MSQSSVHLILTVIGDDRPGLVGELSTVISAHQGSWLESSMAQLAGKFAGIVEVAVDEAHVGALKLELGQLAGLKVTIETAAPQKSALKGRRLKLALVGHDEQVSVPAVVEDLPIPLCPPTRLPRPAIRQCRRVKPARR